MESKRFLILGLSLSIFLFLGSCGSLKKSQRPPADISDTTDTTSTAVTPASSGVQSNAAAIREVSAEQFSKLLLLDEVQLLDVRTPEEYAEGHIKGSTLINIKDTDFAEKIESLDKTRPVLVYCRSGKRSMTAAKILAEAGFSKVISLKGGIIDWNAEELPVEK